MRRANRTQDTIQFDGVPLQEAFDACIFHERAVANPLLRRLPEVPFEGATDTVRGAHFLFEKRWTVTGRVVSRGKPVKGATVRFEAANIAEATARVFQDQGGIDRVALPILPFARQWIITDKDGTFEFESYLTERPAYVIVDGVPERRKTVEIVGSGGRDCGDIEVESTPGEPSVRLAFPDARQRTCNIRISDLTGLPVDRDMLDDWMEWDRRKSTRQTTLRGDRDIVGPVSLEPGKYLIRARTPGAENQWIEVTVRGAVTVSVK